MLRIVQVIGGMDPAGGGPSAVAGRLAGALAQAGQHVTMACWLDPAARQRIDRDLSRVAGMQQVQWFDLPSPLSTIERYFAREWRRRLEELLPNADFVHVHGMWEPTLRIAADISYQYKIPFAITPHGMLDPWAMNQKRLKKQIAMMIGVRRMLNHAAFIHCMNDDERRCIEPLGLTTALEVIPNGVGAEEFAQLPAPGGFYRSRPELNGDPYLLFLGRLHPGKGVEYLVDAFTKLAGEHPRLRLVIAGPDAGAGEALRRQIQQSGVENRVHMVGPIYGPDKFAALVDAVCFVLPSEHECFSIAVLESLACGVPVVISQETHFPEVEQANVGFVMPRNADAFAGAIGRLLTDESLRQSMGQRARQFVHERYTWDKVALTAIAAYQRARKALAERPAGR